MTLHPRPRLTRERWTDLCGTWQFAFDDTDAGLDDRWFERTEAFAHSIEVPYPPESKLSGIADRDYHPVVWYRRTFIAAPDANGRLLLHFGAVDYHADVWVNGHLVASHEGGHSPFFADVTTSLVAAGKQVVVVRAEDQPLDATVPRGKQDWKPRPHDIWYDRTTGIWQPVWLEPVPAIHIRALHFAADIAAAQVGVEVSLNGRHDGWLHLTFRRDNEVVAEQRVRVAASRLTTAVVIDRLRHGQDRGRLLWTPENPNLIDVTAQLLAEDGTPVDTVQSYVGVRTTTTGHGRFLLNDKPYFIRAVLEQGFWPDSHLAAPDADALKAEVELIKALGFNTCRVHQKVEDPRFLYWADRLGLLVWGEMANAYEFSPAAVTRLTREWMEVVERDRSNPCIATWTPLNESWGVQDIAWSPAQQAYVTALYSITRALDPTRPAISNEGWEHTTSDIIGVHDYTQHAGQLIDRFGSAAAIAESITGMKSNRRRVLVGPPPAADAPVMLTEFGGLSFHPAAGQEWFGYATVSTTEEYETLLGELLLAVHSSTALAGFCYTQLTDTQQERNGLLDERRQPKLPLETIRAIISQPSHAVPTEFLDVARSNALIASRSQKEP